MVVDIRFSRTAMRALLRSGKAALIRQKIEQLASDPQTVAGNVTRLKGRPESRLRVQDWRVIFRIEGGVLWVDDIGPRSGIY